MIVLVGAFNQEKALVGAFSVIVTTDCETDGALHSTSRVAVSLNPVSSEHMAQMSAAQTSQFNIILTSIKHIMCG